MCTFSIIPLIGALGRREGYRVVVNRDELIARAHAAQPMVRTVNGREACWPTDTAGGGTWIAAMESGLTLGLLNVNLGEHEPPNEGVRTRGEVIPRLAGCENATAAAAALRHTTLKRYRPFRVVAIDRERIIDLRWDRCTLTEIIRPLASSCFVSSGLGDHVVEPRLMFFDSTFAGVTATPQMQDMFHRHVWPGHEHMSVMMNRATAHTKSVTTVEARWTDDARPRMLMHHSDAAGESSVELGALVPLPC